MRLRFCVLGTPEIRVDTGLVPLPGARSRILVTALALLANTSVSADRLAAALWDEPPPDAETQVHADAAMLGQALRTAGGSAAARLSQRSDGYLLAIEQGELDVDRFALLYRQGRAALAAEDHYAAAHLLGQALATWRDGADPAAGWLRSRLGDLAVLRSSAAEGRLVAQLMLGRRELAADAGLLPERVRRLLSVVTPATAARMTLATGVSAGD